RALELGINWIDTAAVYGLGHSEEVVGRLLGELPAGERPLVFTKCGLAWDARDPMKEARRVLRPDSIRKECDASLRRLGVERIDLYQFHWPDETGTPVEDSWHAMARLVEQGKVRAAGVSNFARPPLERCEAVRPGDSLQAPGPWHGRESRVRSSAPAPPRKWTAGLAPRRASSRRRISPRSRPPYRAQGRGRAPCGLRRGLRGVAEQRRGAGVPLRGAHPHPHLGGGGPRAAAHAPPYRIGVRGRQRRHAAHPAGHQRSGVPAPDAA